MLKECIRSYFLHGSIFCLGIYVSVSKPSICFGKQVLSVKWRNKLVIHNINLTGHTKSACCLRLLVFLEILVITPFQDWWSKDLPKGCCQHNLKAFWGTGYKSALLNIIENMNTRILFEYIIYPSCEMAFKNGRVKSKLENCL